MVRQIIIIISFITLFSCNINEKSVDIIVTSDIHGAFFPYDLHKDKYIKNSLARVQTYLNEQRKNSSLLLLDNGDRFDIKPTILYYNQFNRDSTHIIAEALNHLEYDGVNMGNRDIEAGKKIFDRVKKEYSFPVICANIVSKKDGKPYYTPYKTFEKNDVRITVIGLTTPMIKTWIPKTLWSGLDVEDPIECSKKWCKIIKEKEDTDILICLYHSDGDDPKYNYYDRKNSIEWCKNLAINIPCFDIIVGSYHNKSGIESVISSDGHKTHIVVGNENIQDLVHLKIKIKNKNNIITKVVESKIVPMAYIKEDHEYVLNILPKFRKAEEYYSNTIGDYSVSLNNRNSFWKNTPIRKYIHQIQLETTKADISFTNAPSYDIELIKEKITIRDIFKIYKYSNSLYTVKLRGHEIKQYLEYSYDLFFKTMKDENSNLIKLTKDNKKLINRYYKFDTASGINYTVDISKKKGSRITIVSLSQNKPFRQNKTYTVVLNSFRVQGGGGHLPKGLGFTKEKIKSRIVKNFPHDLRQLIYSYIITQKGIKITNNSQWKLIPESWAYKAQMRESSTISRIIH